MADQQPFSALYNEFAMNPSNAVPLCLLVDVSGSMGRIVEGETTDLGYTFSRRR